MVKLHFDGMSLVREILDTNGWLEISPPSKLSCSLDIYLKRDRIIVLPEPYFGLYAEDLMSNGMDISHVNQVVKQTVAEAFSELQEELHAFQKVRGNFPNTRVQLVFMGGREISVPKEFYDFCERMEMEVVVIEPMEIASIIFFIYDLIVKDRG